MLTQTYTVVSRLLRDGEDGCFAQVTLEPVVPAGVRGDARPCVVTIGGIPESTVNAFGRGARVTLTLTPEQA